MVEQTTALFTSKTQMQGSLHFLHVVAALLKTTTKNGRAEAQEGKGKLQNSRGRALYLASPQVRRRRWKGL